MGKLHPANECGICAKPRVYRTKVIGRQLAKEMGEAIYEQPINAEELENYHWLTADICRCSPIEDQEKANRGEL